MSALRLGVTIAAVTLCAAGAATQPHGTCNESESDSTIYLQTKDKKVIDAEPGVGVVEGNYDSNECPADSVALELEECKAYANGADGVTWSGFRKNGYETKRPTGCSVTVKGAIKKAFFSSDPAGAKHKNSKPICKPIGPEPTEPPTPPPSPNCESMCAGNIKPWTVKCGWGKCNQCSDCPTPTPTPYNNNCRSMCAGSSQPSSVKCTWVKCNQCSFCPTPAPTEPPNCESRCYADTAPPLWRHKCGWEMSTQQDPTLKCKKCPECPTRPINCEDAPPPEWAEYCGFNQTEYEVGFR
jgi:hypothetical protein